LALLSWGDFQSNTGEYLAKVLRRRCHVQFPPIVAQSTVPLTARTFSVL
jgi:hypothetical protein